MNIHAETGDRVVYTGQQGEYRDREYAARAGLVPGEIYTVRSMIRNDYETHVAFENVFGYFNSVMFEDYDEPISYPTAYQDDQAGCCVAVQADQSAAEKREYFIEATVQTVVRAYDGYSAFLQAKELLDDAIRTNYASEDPAHGIVINVCQQIPMDVTNG